MPAKEYFMKQGLFIMDLIIIVYENRFHEIDQALVESCVRHGKSVLVVCNKADVAIDNLWNDDPESEIELCDYDESDWEHVEMRKAYARSYCDMARRKFKEELKRVEEKEEMAEYKARLAQLELFVTAKEDICQLMREQVGEATKRNGARFLCDEEALVEKIKALADAI